MKVNWGVRIASSVAVGGGHFARCRALCNALGGAKTYFLDPDTPAPLREEVSGEGALLESRNWGCEALKQQCREGRFSGVIFDGYEFHLDDLAEVSGLLPTVQFCDDDTSLEVDLAIGPTWGAQDLPRHLTGLDFVPLPKQFAAAHEHALRKIEMSHTTPRVLRCIRPSRSDEPDRNGARGLGRIARDCRNHGLHRI